MLNLRRFLRDFRTGRKDYSMKEAMIYLGISRDAFRQLVRAGVINPIEGGGGRGKNLYFSEDDVLDLEKKLAEYR